MSSILAVGGLRTSSQAVYVFVHGGLRGLHPSGLEILSAWHNALALGICMAEMEVNWPSLPRDHALQYESGQPRYNLEGEICVEIRSSMDLDGAIESSHSRGEVSRCYGVSNERCSS